MITHFRAVILTLALVAGSALVASADPIPYQNVGTPNPIIYSFTATGTGDVIAYFAGSTAVYNEQLGMYINGVLSPNGFGLDNHTSALGQAFILGTVTAGDSLVFAINVITPSLGLVYSDPALNTSYDTNGSLGHNHIYSTAYTATSPVFPGIPTGTYVAFEDLKFPNSDFNYFDETYVFTNISTTPTATPEPGTMLLMGIGAVGAAFMRKRKMISAN